MYNGQPIIHGMIYQLLEEFISFEPMTTDIVG